MRKIILKIIPAFIFFLLPAAGWANQPGDGDDDKAFVCVSNSQTQDSYTMETLDKIKELIRANTRITQNEMSKAC